MAVLTTLVRLLELKVEEMEGPSGTGPLEADIALLDHDAAGTKLPSTVQLHNCFPHVMLAPTLHILSK